jgi:hypothetical protein
MVFRFLSIDSTQNGWKVKLRTKKGEERHFVSVIPFLHHHKLSCMGIADIQSLFSKAVALEGGHTDLKK